MSRAPRDPNAKFRYDERRAELLKNFVNGYLNEKQYFERRFDLELDAFGIHEANRKQQDFRTEIAVVRRHMSDPSEETRSVIGPLQGAINGYWQDPDGHLGPNHFNRRRLLMSMPGLGALAWIISQRR